MFGGAFKGSVVMMKVVLWGSAGSDFSSIPFLLCTHTVIRLNSS